MDKELYNYEVALSFAGEDRKFVEEVAEILQDNEIQVFYDKDSEVEFWGKELTEEFDSIYRKHSRFAVLFISKHYLEKKYPKSELRSMLARALESPEEYILPARFDDTELPGLRPTIKYIDLKKHTSQSFAELIIQKIKKRGIKEAKPAKSKTEDQTIVQPMLGYNLALEVLTLCYKIRDEIKECQQPFISVTELSQRKNDGKKKDGETRQQSDILDSWYASFKRYEKIIDIKSELDKLKIKSEILFGVESREKIEELYSIIQRLGVAIQTYHERQLYTLSRVNRDKINRNIINGINRFDYNDLKDTNDGGFEKRLRLSIKGLADYYKNKMSEFQKLVDK